MFRAARRDRVPQCRLRKVPISLAVMLTILPEIKFFFVNLDSCCQATVCLCLQACVTVLHFYRQPRKRAGHLGMARVFPFFWDWFLVFAFFCDCFFVPLKRLKPKFYVSLFLLANKNVTYCGSTQNMLRIVFARTRSFASVQFI